MNTSLKTMIIGMLLIIALPMAKLSAQVSVWDGTHEPWTHGTGTEQDPFLIENAQQLAYLAYRVNNGLDANGTHVSSHDLHYKLMVDVNLNGSETFQWTPIGYWNSNTDYQCFGGNINGNNHTVSGMYINSTANRVGFMGYASGAIIENLYIRGEGITASGRYAGGIVGYCVSTTIKNCSNYCDLKPHFHCVLNDSDYYSGGIAGFSYSSNIMSCFNAGAIHSSFGCLGDDNSEYGIFAGGIVGIADGTIITNSYNTGNIVSSVDYAYCDNTIFRAYAGGIIGLLDYTGSNNYPDITSCYNVGSVSAWYEEHYKSRTNFVSYLGGLVAYSEIYSSVYNCYYLETCGGNNVYGGQPLSSRAMQSTEFVDMLNDGTCSWKPDDTNSNNGYPVLTMMIVNIATWNATNVTQTRATIRGLIITENESILAQGFEYKNNDFYDSDYHVETIANNGNISFSLSGLKPDTQYKYRTFCTIENCGTFYGEEKTFTTLPISVTTYPATNVTNSSAILHGSIDIGDATLISKGFVYTFDYNTLIEEYCEGNDNVLESQINGLQNNTTYCYSTFVEIETSEYGNLRCFSESGECFDVSWLNSDTIYIYDADMLRWVSEECNSGTTFEGKYLKLMNDITLPLNVPNNMTSIGRYPYLPFMGTFDGNGKHIYNLYIDQPNTAYQGFFGYTLNANLYNVGLVNITASGRNYTGGMVAYAENTHLRDCYVNGGTLFALSYCGGLIGYQEQGTNSIVSGCYNTCSVSGNHYVGGLIGFSNYSTVRNSYVAGPVSGQGNGIGAIIGGANEVLMYYCYFSTDLTGQTVAIGENNFKNGSEGLTNAQMRDPQFVATLNQGLVTPVWMADYATPINNGFPIIKWQRPGTGIEENNFVKNYVSLYPNPANGFVTIQSDDSGVSLKTLEIYDVTGRKVMSEILDGQSQNVSIAKLLSGVYHVRIQTDNGCYTNLTLVVQ